VLSSHVHSECVLNPYVPSSYQSLISVWIHVYHDAEGKSEGGFLFILFFLIMLCTNQPDRLLAIQMSRILILVTIYTAHALQRYNARLKGCNDSLSFTIKC
jgi:hypothetical protein